MVDDAGNPTFGPPPRSPGAPAGTLSRFPGVPDGTPEPDGIVADSTLWRNQVNPSSANACSERRIGNIRVSTVLPRATWFSMWDHGMGTAAAKRWANDTTSTHAGDYILITFQGSEIQLLGQTGPGDSCTLPATAKTPTAPSSCGAVNIDVDGDYKTAYSANLASATPKTDSSGVFFDFKPRSNLQTGNQHTLKVMVAGPQTAGGPVLPVSLQSIVVSRDLPRLPIWWW